MAEDRLTPLLATPDDLGRTRDRGACERRLVKLLVDRSRRELARVRFEGGGPPELLAAFDSVEKSFVARQNDSVALDPERNTIVARDQLTQAYRLLFRPRHRVDDRASDVELVARGVAEGLRLLREDLGESEPADQQRGDDGDVVEDVPEAWLLRLTLVLVHCVLKTKGFLDTTFEDDEIVLEGVARYGPGTATARGVADRDLKSYGHVFDDDGEDHKANRMLDQVVIVPGTTNYVAQHTMFEQDWFDQGSATARVLATALGTIVSVGLDTAIAAITDKLQDDVDDETDPDKKRQRQQRLKAWLIIRDSTTVQSARDELEGVVVAFFRRLFEADAFNMFTTLVDIEWDPTGLPVWTPASVTNIGFFKQRENVDKLVKNVAELEKLLKDQIKRGDTDAIRGTTEILAGLREELNLARVVADLPGRQGGDPDRVVGAGTSILDDILVPELDDGTGEYRVSMKYEMIPARLAPV